MDWPDLRADLFDPQKVPFSRRGSFIAISWLAEDAAFWLRNLRGGDEHTDLGRMLRLDLLDTQGAIIDAQWSLTPDCLTARTRDGAIHLSFDGPDRLVFRGNGPGLRLSTGASKYNYAQSAPGHVHVCIARQDLRCNIALEVGGLNLGAVWNGLSSDQIKLDLQPASGALEGRIDLFRIDPIGAPFHTQPQAAQRIADEFADFRNALPKGGPEFAAGHLLASYILWSAYVPAEGALAHPAIYMSKNWMTNIWSWDHCFVALAFGKNAPDLAFEQMQAIFAAQSVSGRLPDYINDRYAYWAFTKPPVHGWTFAQLRKLAPEYYTPQRKRQVLHWLDRQTRFWLSGPCLGDLPAYRHGNDAGWDNATCFAEGGPLVGPDLATFLILQLDEITRLHTELGNIAQARTTRQQADELCKALLTDLWDGAGFVAKLQNDGRVVTTGQSLLLYLPLLLGTRLPAEKREALLSRLLQPGRHLTEYGLATEATDSPLYRANGYWRGPIWAPTTALFVDALNRCGENAAALQIARRYCQMCNTSGMAENNDALTGQGLHDPAFAWTSAVFLRLGESLLATDA